MFCQICGKELNDNANFCDGCGQKVVSENISDSNEEEIKKKSNRKTIGIVLAIVFVAFSLIIGRNFSSSDPSTSISITSKQISSEAIEKANEHYKGYTDHIVTPKKANYTIQQIYLEDEKVFVVISDNKIFNKAENDSTYGVSLGNTISLFMSDFFPEGTSIIIKCGDNIVFTGNTL